MALIICKDCNKDISDQAKMCPNCGAPLSLAQITIEKTSKEIKKKYLQVICFIVLGIGVMLIGDETENKNLVLIGVIIMILALVSLLVTKSKEWWNHG